MTAKKDGTNPSQKQRRYREKNREKIAAVNARWNKANRERLAAASRRYAARNPQKIKARRRLRQALLSGQIVRGACERAGPGCRGRVQAHHDDYTRPLDVRWLCTKHHGEEHRL